MLGNRQLSSRDLSFQCPLNWDDMEKSEHGRFCTKCQQDVYDLRDCSIDELVELQKKKGSICGLVTILGATALSLTSCTIPNSTMGGLHYSKPRGLEQVEPVKEKSVEIISPEKKDDGRISRTGLVQKVIFYSRI